MSAGATGRAHYLTVATDQTALEMAAGRKRNEYYANLAGRPQPKTDPIGKGSGTVPAEAGITDPTGKGSGTVPVEAGITDPIGSGSGTVLVETGITDPIGSGSGTVPVEAGITDPIGKGSGTVPVEAGITDTVRAGQAQPAVPPQKTDALTNVIPFDFQNAKPAAAFAGLPMENLAEGITLFTKKTATKPIKTVADGSVQRELPRKEQPASKADQAKQSGANLPKFDHATALEFYDAVQPSAFILGYKSGRSITNAEGFQALAKEADDKHEHLFFHVATVKPTWISGTTATKDQILECTYLWGDCDAEKYAGNDPVEAANHYKNEGSRVRTAIDKGLIARGITPSAMWRSGAGWQFLIKLDHAIAPDEAEILVGKLHTVLGFDPVVRNCNRILRVPGSVNWKDGKDGRVPASCMPLCLLHTVTKIDDVRKALANVSEAEAKPSGATTIDWSKVQRPGWLKSVADLPDDVPVKLKHIIGHTGTLKDLSDDLAKLGHLSRPYRSWSDVTQAIAGSFKFYGKYTPEQIAEALLADLPCNHHIANQKDKERAIERAIARSFDPRPKVSVNGHWPDGQDDDTGNPKRGILNTIEAFKRAGITCTWDEFRQKEYWTGHDDKKFDGEVRDAAVTVTRRNLKIKFRLYPEITETRDAITCACQDNKSNPVVDYFNGLKWDGKPRLDKMLHTYLGADDTPLNAAIGRKVMCAIDAPRQATRVQVRSSACIAIATRSKEIYVLRRFGRVSRPLH